jgi:hypothetical protein
MSRAQTRLTAVAWTVSLREQAHALQQAELYGATNEWRDDARVVDSDTVAGGVETSERYLFDMGNGDGVVVWTGGRDDWSDEYCFNDFIDNVMTSEFGFCGSGMPKGLQPSSIHLFFGLG